MKSWNELGALVTENIEDHERRIEKLEAAYHQIQIDMVRLTTKYSFLGSLTGSAVTIITAILLYWAKSK